MRVFRVLPLNDMGTAAAFYEKGEKPLNIAIIFAGGTGRRMHSKDRPKQFLLVHGKPIIVHTIEVFQYHEEIDGIVVACLHDLIPYLEQMNNRYRLD